MSDEARHSEDLVDLAGKVADGTVIDWAEAQNTFTGPPGRLKGLRVIERVSRAHRDLVVLEGGTPAAPSRSDVPFRSWGSLDLLAPIARGGFGEVYRARDLRLDRTVALKLLLSDGGRAGARAERFLEEARRLATVRHPNVVAVFGVDRFVDRDGLWMEWIDGETLEDGLRSRGPLGAHEAALVGIEICRAMAAVHAAGLVHRDVKLSNVVRERGGRIVLMDFGSSTRSEPEDSDSRPLSGTPMYLAPEAFEARDSGVQMDVYALGVALYRLTSGEYPLRAGSTGEMLRQHREHAAVPLRDRNPALPTGFVRIVERAMHPDPSQRFASAGAMERALDAFVSGIHETAGHEASSRGWRPAIVSAASVALVVLAALAIPRLLSEKSGTGFEAEATFYLWNEERHTQERLADGSRIATGDQLFLELESSEPAWVYVVNEDARGNEFLLFPLEGLDGANPLPGGRTARLPGEVGGVEQAWDVTSAGGEETLLVVASRRPLDEIERRIGTLARSGSARPGNPAAGGVSRVLRGLGGLSPAPSPSPGGRTTLGEVRDRVALRAGGEGDVRMWELKLSNPE